MCYEEFLYTPLMASRSGRLLICKLLPHVCNIILSFFTCVRLQHYFTLRVCNIFLLAYVYNIITRACNILCVSTALYICV